MDIVEAEDLLFEKLSMPRESSRLHMEALDVAPPKSLEGVVAVGLDTNVLKVLRRDSLLADRLLVSLSTHKVTLVLPSQVVIEYWNNHQIFANDDWVGFQKDLTSLAKRISNGSLAGYDGSVVAQISELVAGISSDLHDAKSPEYLAKSTILMKSLLEAAMVPRVSRTRFAGLASARLASKTPPGFADLGSKVAASGDFYVWCDYLMGVLQVPSLDHRTDFLWITDDSKPDWKTGAGGHPSLIEEFLLVRGGNLSIASSDTLNNLLRSQDVSTGPGRHEDMDD